MEKRSLNSMAIKDKEKATITAIKYSVLDKAMLFSFYNHPQLLWVWADGTSISLGKLNLHVDDGGRVNVNIKREVSNPKRVAGKKGQEPEPPRLCRGERLLQQTWFISVWVPWLTPSSDQGLVFQAHALQIILFEPLTCELSIILGSLQIESLHIYIYIYIYIHYRGILIKSID